MTDARELGQHTYAGIQRQPADVRRLLEGDRKRYSEAAGALRNAGRVHIAGIGTSYHAALVAEQFFRAAELDARPVLSFDFSLYPPPLESRDAVVVISHTGRKQYSAQAIDLAKASGCTVIGITAEDSAMQGADYTLETVEKERSACYTYSYTAALTSLALLACEAGAPLSEGLDLLPNAMQTMLASEDTARKVAALLAGDLWLIGGGPNAATAMEGALKVKEASYVQAEGMPVEMFLHGPVVSIEPADALVAVAPAGPGRDRVRQTVEAARYIGVESWVIGEGIEETAWYTPLPDLPEALTPLAAVVPLQLLAYHLALVRGVNADDFHTSDERFMSAIRSLTL